MDEFYYSEEFYDHLSNTFITIIPKKKRALELRDYCPISILSNVYKIISKLLVGRLKMVMKGILIANECIEDRKLSGRSGVIYKLDLKKKKHIIK